MANKIFVSYKYRDRNVLSLKKPLEEAYEPTTVRTYVDKLEEYFDRASLAIYKGESDGEDLSYLNDDQIWERLKDKIYDSTITIVMISPNMKESHRSDRLQWIPWEVSYSLKEMMRNDRRSRSNALLGIVLPDSHGNYNYFLENKQCFNCQCKLFNVDIIFDILKKNMFNEVDKSIKDCKSGRMIYLGEHSYFTIVTWSDFILSPQVHLDWAIEKKNRISGYEIRKEV